MVRFLVREAPVTDLWMFINFLRLLNFKRYCYSNIEKRTVLSSLSSLYVFLVSISISILSVQSTIQCDNILNLLLIRTLCVRIAFCIALIVRAASLAPRTFVSFLSVLHSLLSRSII